MRPLILGALLLLHIVYVVSQAPPSIAIVGAGIGGGGCAYYLNKFAGISGAQIYESRSYIGGRINEIQFGGQLEEIGADAWSSVNYYLQEIVQELDIQIGNSTYSGNGLVGIWSTGFVDWKKYALQNRNIDTCVSAQIEQFIEQLTLNYGIRESQGPFSTINGFLQPGDLDYYSTQVFSDILSKCNATQEYMDTLIAPIVRAIYDQTLEVQGFAGEVSLVSIATPPFWAANGNSQLPKTMISASSAQVHLQTQVNEITWTGSKYQLNWNSSATQGSSLADIVVIAAPIEKTGIQFTNITNFQMPTSRNFVTCYVTHVQASGVNPVYFGLQSTDTAPDVILTTPESTLPFTILQVEDESLTLPGAKIYKLFSNVDVTNVLSQIFIDVTDSHVQAWPYTFPYLNPTSNYQPILLGTNLYYLNTMESVASAMEASIISARNTAQLISNSLQ